MNTKDTILHIRISSEKLDRYRVQAEVEGRSLGNWIEWHLDPVVEAVPRLTAKARKGAIPLEQLRTELGLKKPEKAPKKRKGRTTTAG